MTRTGRALLAWSTVLAISLAACGQEAQSPKSTVVAPAQPTGDGPAPAAPSASSGATWDANAWPYAPALTEEEKAAQLARLEKEPGPIKTNWVPPGKSERYGHTEARIDAPYDVVRGKLADFTLYKELAGSRFKKVQVVDKQQGGTDLYFLLPIMKGLITIWYVTRFMPPRPGAGGTEVIEGKLVKGNVKDVHMIFTIRPMTEDKQRTIMTCDLLLGLSIPAPQANVDEELRDACGESVHHLRFMIHGH